MFSMFKKLGGAETATLVILMVGWLMNQALEASRPREGEQATFYHRAISFMHFVVMLCLFLMALAFMLAGMLVRVGIIPDGSGEVAAVLAGMADADMAYGVFAALGGLMMLWGRRNA